MSQRTCSIPECVKPARSKSAEWCKMQYHRWYRHGSTDKTHATAPTASHGRRYVVVYAPRHPIAGARGMAYQHRVTLFDSIGPGVHPCHWCEVPVRWEANKTDPDVLQVDHVNGIGDDNRVENLAPSCSRCNSSRSAGNRAKALRDAGWWSNHDTQCRA